MARRVLWENRCFWCSLLREVPGKVLRAVYQSTRESSERTKKMDKGKMVLETTTLKCRLPTAHRTTLTTFRFAFVAMSTTENTTASRSPRRSCLWSSPGTPARCCVPLLLHLPSKFWRKSESSGKVAATLNKTWTYLQNEIKGKHHEQHMRGKQVAVRRANRRE